jgi:hypothetical protein
MPLKGKIVIDYYSNTDRHFDELWHMTFQLCDPKITITPAGNLSNSTCMDGRNPNPAVHVGEFSFTFQIMGMVEPSGNVKFSYDVNQTGSPHGTWRVILGGEGKFTSPIQAAGTANFSYTCDDFSEYIEVANLCGTSDIILGHESYKGTVSWSFVPSP